MDKSKESNSDNNKNKEEMAKKNEEKKKTQYPQSLKYNIKVLLI